MSKVKTNIEEHFRETPDGLYKITMRYKGEPHCVWYFEDRARFQKFAQHLEDPNRGYQRDQGTVLRFLRFDSTQWVSVRPDWP